jgi:hypothetical protein
VIRLRWPSFAILLVGVGQVPGLPRAGAQQSPPAGGAAPLERRGPGEAAGAPAPLDDPLRVIPAQCMFCWRGQPLPGCAPVTDQQPTLVTLAELWARLAGRPLDRRAQLAARILEAFELLSHRSHAMAFLALDEVAAASPTATAPADPAAAATSKPVNLAADPEVVRFALVLARQGDSKLYRQFVKRILDEQTDERHANLQLRQAESWKFQELRDQRLPDWCTICWGDLDEYFVFTIGPDVWPAVAATAAGRTPALSQDPWILAARQEVRKASQRPPAASAASALVAPNQPQIEIFGDVRKLRDRLDPLVGERATAFAKAWHIDDAERTFWGLGLQGRALYCLASFLTPRGETLTRLYADPRASDPRWLAAIPADAHYAIYRVPVGEIVPRFFGGLYALRGKEVRAEAEALWARVQTEYGFNAQRDILDHLGNTVILHNDPPHPLQIPLAVTVLLEIRDQPATVRQSVEKICAAWQAALDRAVRETGIPSPGTLQHDDDGIWYVQFGPLAGPAWTVTERFFISSWSPAALRAYLDKVGSAVGARAP